MHGHWGILKPLNRVAKIVTKRVKKANFSLKHHYIHTIRVGQLLGREDRLSSSRKRAIIISYRDGFVIEFTCLNPGKIILKT